MDGSDMVQDCQLGQHALIQLDEIVRVAWQLRPVCFPASLHKLASPFSDLAPSHISHDINDLVMTFAGWLAGRPSCGLISLYSSCLPARHCYSPTLPFLSSPLLSLALREIATPPVGPQ